MVEAKIKALRDELERHNYNYYVLSAPTISDFEFDKMMKELQELEAAHPEFADPDSPTRRVGSDLSKEFEQVVHKYPMLSLGNTYSEDEIRDFYDRTVRSLNEPFEIVAELKFKSVYLEIVLEPTGSPVSRYVWMIAFNIFLFLSSNSVSTKISSFLLYSPVSTRFSGVLTSMLLR